MQKRRRWKAKMTPIHYSVLYREVLEFLAPEKEDSLFLDGTLGEGGHSLRMLEKYPTLKQIGLDADPVMLERARQRLIEYASRVDLRNVWFNQFLADYPAELKRPDRMLFDLGISVYHYEGTGRGFSFRKDEKLDMRLNPNLGLSAYEVVNDYSQKDLQDIFSLYGEEKYSGRIARVIVESREKEKIETTEQLANLIRGAVPAEARYGHIHPATQVFQAIRIEVNGELDRLKEMLESAYRVLECGGLLGVITFHSLEDRLVKNFFSEKHKKNRRSVNKYAIQKEEDLPFAELLFKKPISASELEVSENPPSRSARLRVIKKLREEEIDAQV